MKYRNLALTIALAVSVHSTCYATTEAGMADSEGRPNTVNLLPDSDGGVGQIAVTTAGGTGSLSQPNSPTTILSYSQPPTPPGFIPPLQIQSLYGDNRPSAPSPATPSPQGGAGLSEPTLLQTLFSLSSGTAPPPSSTPAPAGQLPQASALFSGIGPAPVPPTQSNQGLPAPSPSPGTIGPSVSIENLQTDRLTSVITSQNISNLATAQYFFAQGRDADVSALSSDTISYSQYITWGSWATPLQSNSFTQPFGMVYNSNAITNMTTVTASGTAVYGGLLKGSVAYNNTSANITAEITMNVNFANHTLSFSGANGGISGSGSWTATASSPAVNGQLSYNGSLNNLSASLTGSFAGSFFGNVHNDNLSANIPLEMNAAWAMSGNVGGKTANAAGLLLVSHP